MDLARKAGIENVDIPVVEVGKATKCKIDFKAGSHPVRSVELLEYGIVSLAGDIDTEGQFVLLGLSPGNTKVRVRVAHARSLKVMQVEFSVTVTGVPQAG